MGTFQTIGGTEQFRVHSGAELYEVIDLDSAFFAALSAPLDSLTADSEFLTLLDSDHNRSIRVDDLRAALAFLRRHLPSGEELMSPEPRIPVEAFGDPDMIQFIGGHPELVENGMVTLARAREFRTLIATGRLRGDGILLASALTESADANLLTQIISLGGGAANASGETGMTATGINRFLDRARGYLEWREKVSPELPGGAAGAAALYGAFGAVRGKIDEYFRCCELVKLDPANLARFQLDPAKGMPELAVGDPAALTARIAATVLAQPGGEMVLSLDDPRLNPAYAEPLGQLFGCYGIEKLAFADWNRMVRQLSPGADFYLATDGAEVGKLDVAVLEDALGEGRCDVFFKLLKDDERVGGVVAAAEDLIKILVFKEHILEFVDDFVNFNIFFDPRKRSMAQAGTLFMDGYRYDLATWIDSVAGHKKLAARANLCLIYLELASPCAANGKKFVAVAVTSGSLNHVYTGKPVVFLDCAGAYHNGRVADLLDGPISFKQSLLLPFRKLAAIIGTNFQKYADISSLEKKVAAGTAPAPATAPAGGGVKNLLSNGSMLLLAGGVSLAAVGSSFAYVVKSLGQLSLLRFLCGVGGILLVILVPTALVAIYKLRRRELGAFLEASGWAINLPMRLSMLTARIFSYKPVAPEGSSFDRSEFCRTLLKIRAEEGTMVRDRRLVARLGKVGAGAFLWIGILYALIVLALICC